jgi:hypothetical protein
MIFGTVFTGQVKTQERQYIETKVFCFIVPLFVVTTLLVTEVTANGRRGLEIKSNRASIIATIIRPLISVLCIFAIGAFIGNYNTMLWLLIPALLTTALFIYVWFYFGKTTKYERFVREQFGKQFGLYFMPNWLKPFELKSKFEGLKKIYISNFGTTDWKEKIRNMPYYKEEFSLLYCLSALENTINNNPETEKMLREISTNEI